MDVAADVLFCFVNLFHKTSCDGPETNRFVAILISSFYEILSVYAAVTNIFLHLSLSRAAFARWSGSSSGCVRNCNGENNSMGYGIKLLEIFLKFPYGFSCFS